MILVQGCTVASSRAYPTSVDTRDWHESLLTKIMRMNGWSSGDVDLSWPTRLSF